MDKRVREMSRFFVAPPRVFPLSVWRVSGKLFIQKYLRLSNIKSNSSNSTQSFAMGPFLANLFMIQTHGTAACSVPSITVVEQKQQRERS